MGADDDYAPSKKKSGFSSFASLGVDPSEVGMEDEEDFGGLMVSENVIVFCQLTSLLFAGCHPSFIWQIKKGQEKGEEGWF